jgi:hypothetical protein
MTYVWMVVTLIVCVFCVYKVWRGSRRQVVRSMAAAIAEVRADVRTAAAARATASNVNVVTLNLGAGAGAGVAPADPVEAGEAAGDEWLAELEDLVGEQAALLPVSQLERIEARFLRGGRVERDARRLS